MAKMSDEAKAALAKAFAGVKVKDQGKIIAQAEGNGWLMMTPDGNVKYIRSRKGADIFCKKWFEKNLDQSGKEIGIGKIEWRT